MTAELVSVPGGRLKVVDDGRPGDPPILLLHAAIADLRSWDDLVPPLVTARYRVVRYDLRGFGQTTTDEVDYSNRGDALAVLDAIGIERAALVGNSAGGQIAIDTAIESPDRVVAVVGVAAGLGGFESHATPEEVAAFERGEALEAADPPDVDAIVDLDLRLWVDGLGQPENRIRATIRDKVRAMDAGQYAADRVSGRPIPLKPPADARLADLRCPVLAVAGALDVSEVAQTARHLEANAPDARAVIMPGVAHMIGMEAPDELAALIVEFLAPLPRWS
jgi:pimeloyl-ACP methyl ester carboxylesterase